MKTIEWYHCNPSLAIFQHDNDPKDIAKPIDKQWSLMQNFDVLTWPPQLPNSTPIKNVWALVKHKLNEHPSLAKRMLQMWEYVQAYLHFITLE